MILQRGLVVPLALLVGMVTASVTLYVGISDAPAGFFGEADLILLLPPGELVPGQGSIDASLVAPLADHPSVARLSAEVYAPTIVQGRSVLARGVHFEDFLAIEPGARVEGRLPASAGETLVGVALARALDLAIGDTIIVPGSKSNAIVKFEIVGFLGADGPARDEIVCPLASARVLVDMRPADVHVIRIDPADRAAVVALVRGIGPTFSYSNVTLSTSEALPGEIITLSAHLTNWGPRRASNVSTIRGDDVELATRSFDLDARSTRLIEIPFRVPDAGLTNVTLNPTLEVRTRAPTLQFEVDAPASRGVPLRFLLAHPDGTPAGGVRVDAGAVRTATAADGTGSISPPADGVLQLKAVVDGRAVAIADVFVAQEGAAERAHPRVLGAGASTVGGYARANETLPLRVQLMNAGGVAGIIEVPIHLDDTIVGTARAGLAPGEDTVVTLQLPPLVPGEYALRVGSVTLQLTAIDGDPAIGSLLANYDAAALRPATDIGEAHAGYIEQVTGNVRLAIVALSVATGALALTAALAVLARHVGERAPVLGILKALGASDEQIHERAAREALALGAIAGALGIFGGIAVALSIQQAHVLHAFGHEIHPRFPWHVLALVFLQSMLFVMLATRLNVAALLRRRPDALMRGQTARGRREEGADRAQG